MNKFKATLVCLAIFIGCGFYAHTSDAQAARDAGKSTTWTQVKDGK